MAHRRNALFAIAGGVTVCFMIPWSSPTTARGNLGKEDREKLVREQKFSALTQKLLANGFELGERGELARRGIPFKDVCRLVECKSADFQAPATSFVPSVGMLWFGPPYHAHLAHCTCLVWPTELPEDKQDGREELENAIVDVAVLPAVSPLPPNPAGGAR